MHQSIFSQIITTTIAAHGNRIDRVYPPFLHHAVTLEIVGQVREYKERCAWHEMPRHNTYEYMNSSLSFVPWFLAQTTNSVTLFLKHSWTIMCTHSLLISSATPNVHRNCKLNRSHPLSKLNLLNTIFGNGFTYMFSMRLGVSFWGSTTVSRCITPLEKSWSCHLPPL